MAEKGFGVKEINLIGASGTPTITSPNNINLNAANVAISTNVSIGGTLTVTGNVSVGGTLTYEDVTNIDSVGIVTAREGIKIPDDKHLRFGTDNDTSIVHSGTNTTMNVNGNYFFQGNTFYVQNQAGTKNYIRVYPLTDGRVEIYNDNNKKFETSSSGATVTGTLTATTFSGSGASLTNLPAANLTGTLPAISGANLTNLPASDPTNSDVQVAYTVTANGSSAYRFAGNGVVSTADDPDLYLIRGHKYRFINNSGGSHPFQIRVASGGAAYSTGVTNNGAASGNIDFAPTFDSPAQLVYQCTSHGGMVGNIYLRDAAGGNTNVGVTTFSGGITVSGNTSFAGGNVTMTASGSPNSLNVSGTSRFEIASIENAEIDGEIAHSGDTDTKISFDTNTIKFNTAGSERLRITSGGSIKVGFINNVNPTTMFDVMANAINQDIVRFTGANYNRGLKISTAASGAVSDALIKYDAESQNNAGQHAFLTDGTERLRIDASGLTTLQLASSGNFVEPLRLRNAAAGANTDVGMIFYNDGAGAMARIKAYDAGTYNGGLIFETAPTAGSLNNNTSEALRINHEGKVMINTTNSASRTLNLNGTFGILSTNQSAVIDMSVTDAGVAVIAPYVAGGSSLEFKTNASGSGVTQRLRIEPGGNVIPGADNAQDLGSSSKRWANIYSADLQLSNVGTGGNEVDGTEGKWTLQEAEDTVYMINRINGKRYKIKMEEV